MNKIIALIGIFILLGGCSKSGLEGKYICDGKLLNGLEFKSDGRGYANIRGRETVFEYTIDEDRVVLTANGESNVVTIKEDSLVGDAAYGTCFPISGNPLFGHWKVESEQNKNGEVELPDGAEDGYIAFFPSKMVIGGRGKSITATVLDYAVEDGRVMVTAEAEGEQKIIQVQLLDGDRIKWVEDKGTGKDTILRRVGTAASE